MAEKADKPDSVTPNQDSETIFNSDIGDDWGEIFASEDTMFSQDEEAASSFFLEEEGNKGGGPSPAKAESDAVVGEITEKNKSRQSAFSVQLSRLLSLLIGNAQLIKTRLQALSLMGKLVTAIAALASLFIVFFLLAHPHHGSAPAVPSPVKQAQIKLTGQNHSLTSVSPEAVVRPAQRVLPKTQTFEAHKPLEKVRKKWHLPSFFIAIAPQKGSKPTILTIDLTLVMLLDHNQLPPKNRKIFIRDLIYQFFNNQPLAEIQRYSLARGDMNRRLRAWIEKQWPDIPLSAIIFNRYQIL